MSFDYTSLGSDLASVVKEFGTAVSITRQGAGVLKGFAVFVAGTSSDDTSSPTSSIAKVSNTRVMAYLAGSYKKAPQPGDELNGKGRDYIVMEVEVYQPADTIVGFKLSLE